MFGFDKTRRLLHKNEFDVVFSHAKKLANTEFTVLFCDNSLGCARLGLIISKKIVNKAHDRNRIKRILRESFRLNSKLPAVDVVILAKPYAKKALPYQMRANLDKLWNRLSTQHGP